MVSKLNFGKFLAKGKTAGFSNAFFHKQNGLILIKYKLQASYSYLFVWEAGLYLSGTLKKLKVREWKQGEKQDKIKIEEWKF